MTGDSFIAEKALQALLRGSKRCESRSNRGESVGFEPGTSGQFRSLPPIQKTTATPTPAEEFCIRRAGRRRCGDHVFAFAAPRKQCRGDRL